MLCAYCTNDRPRGCKELSIPRDAHIFCSARCFLAHIKSLDRLTRDDAERLHLQVNPPGDGHGLDSYSTRLRKAFRSQFEVDLAEWLVCEQGLRVVYEAHVLPVGYKRWYIPDFYLPEYGVWIEAKGEWRGGGKRKFMDALGRIGRDRMLLVPPMYAPWFRGKA